MKLSFLKIQARKLYSPHNRLALHSVGNNVALQAVTKVVNAPNQDELVNDCINAIRFLAIDGVNKAKSGHPGCPMGCAPMGYVLFNEIMNHNPKNPKWFNRDRFVL